MLSGLDETSVTEVLDKTKIAQEHVPFRHNHWRQVLGVFDALGIASPPIQHEGQR